jgi:hypothetical protein
VRALEEVVGEHSGHSRTVLEYALTTKRIVESAKQPGFSARSWAPLAELVAVEEFERVGNFKEVMSWDDYVAFMTKWAPTADWECSFKRITEGPGSVFLELEERTTLEGRTGAVNSLSVYEFDDEDRIRHLDVYLQMPPPRSELLQSYEGVDFSE